ncbi:MAG: hypothetical protein QOH83_1506 [Solirubrobacteraceae bacterium]|nr:hypothetical protein [Solirubrobacteraceae bacterium]
MPVLMPAACAMTDHEALIPQTTSRAHDAAVGAAIQTLLNCYMREGGAWRAVPAADVPELVRPGDTHLAVFPFAALSATLLVGVRHLSATHRHRFRMPVTMIVAGEKPFAVTLDAVAEMLIGALSARVHGNAPDATPALLRRLRASVENVTAFLDARHAQIDALWSAAPLSFIAGEQALLLGPMIHPIPKSRTEMGAAAIAAYSPEHEAQFQLHWLAIDAAIVEHDSATGTPAPALVARLLLDDPGVDRGALDAALAGLGERVLVPAHPWELAHLRATEAVVAALLDDGTIADLGPLGSPVMPTASVRTVYNAGWPWQLTFSLHARVTSSRHVTLPEELRRAVEAARLQQTERGARAAQLAPGLVLLQDPAYLAVRHGGQIIDGLSVLLRDNRWPAGAATDASALTSLCQDHPYGGRSRLGAIVAALARRGARAEDDVAREWFARYCDVVIAPLLALHLDVGLCMTSHQEDVVVELEDGWPARAVYRDSQGSFDRAAPHDDITAIMPLGVINALGVAGCIGERELLNDLRALLERLRARGGRHPTTLLDRLLDETTWPCKANLLTRMNDLDEPAGDVASQSVHVTIPNPLHEGSRS